MQQEIDMAEGDEAAVIAQLQTRSGLRHYEYRLFSSCVSVKMRSVFWCDFECVLPLCFLDPHICVVQYKRLSYVKAAVLLGSGAIGVSGFLILHGSGWISMYAVGALLALVLLSLRAALQQRHVTTYQFLCTVNAPPLTVVAASQNTLNLDRFVQRVAAQIREASTPSENGTTPTRFLPDEVKGAHQQRATASRSLEPGEGSRQDTSESGHCELIVKYRSSGLFDFGEVLVLPTTVVVRRGRRLNWQSETAITTDRLLPRCVRTRYRRRAFGWMLTLSSLIMCVFCICFTAVPGELAVGPCAAILSAVVGFLLLSLMQFPLVTAYHLYYISGARAFSVFGLGPYRHYCQQFIQELTHHIMRATTEHGFNS